MYSGLTLNQDKATKPQTVQIVRQGEATPYWFKVNPLYKGRLKLPCMFQTTFSQYSENQNKREKHLLTFFRLSMLYVNCAVDISN